MNEDPFFVIQSGNYHSFKTIMQQIVGLSCRDCHRRMGRNDKLGPSILSLLSHPTNLQIVIDF